MKNLVKNIYLKHSRLQQLIAFLEKSPKRNLALKNTLNSPLAIIIGEVFDKINKTIFVLAEDYKTAAYFYNDIENFTDEKKVFFFPSSFNKSAYFNKQDLPQIVSRYQCLSHLTAKNEACIIISYPEAVAEKIVSKNEFKKATIKLIKGERFPREKLASLLLEYHFEQVDFVEKPGQFSIRGNIFDVFSFTSLLPHRIDFFGRTIHSIKSFNTDSQLSVENLNFCEILPFFSGDNSQIKSVYLTDYLPNSCILFKYNPLNFPLEYVFLSSEVFTKVIAWGLFHTSELTSEVISFHQKSPPAINKNFELFADILSKNIENGYQNFIFSSDSKRIERIRHILHSIAKSADFTAIDVSIHSGFIDEDAKIYGFAEHQIFNRYHTPRLRSLQIKRSLNKLHVKKMTDLKAGDYVVHIDHGIGRFEGLQKINNRGNIQETICISYQNNDLLFVNSHSLYKISKYKSSEGVTPKINKLGSTTWQKLKQKTKSKVKDIAKDLIFLYAKRKNTVGFAFSTDTYLQEELEASFIYEDTPDQINATNDIKKDMELPHPMDRLLCGDVGFGKTEIAIRAAFKAVADSKQVVVLVPTTILAFQHYNTFSKRLKDFPCTVDYISRLRTNKEQKRVFENLATGRIDIIIGTHRVVQKDLMLKDFGLLIVDEEQKFGVSVKEKLRQIKYSVDTLTLTATPIPRTLQFSLMNARDLSIMQSPPKNRYPITTEIHHFNEEVIQKAILYEVNRGGQVFFIHNRVQSIQQLKDIINQILPDISIEIAHGQMPGSELEKVILRFMHGEIDVLLSTSIVESGLDIPNANTIIIHQAHSFGLSDLYQLRGRVGRSTVHAYCYLIIPPLQYLTRQARDRLNAIEEFSELGSGFNIAMKDLDIRGMGNLLGSEQSGFIMDIGIETYQKILSEAIHELKMNEFKDFFEKEAEKTSYIADCQIKTDFEAYIPDSYIENITERISTYRKINLLQNEAQIGELIDALKDRFGELPTEVNRLLKIVRLRWVALRVGLEQIFLQKQMLIAYFPKSKEHPFFQSTTFDNILDFVKRQAHKTYLQEKKGRLCLTIEGVSSIERGLNLVSSFLK